MGSRHKAENDVVGPKKIAPLASHTAKNDASACQTAGMRRPYTVCRAKIWDKARAAYLAGEPASRVCQRFNLGLSALRKRAKAEGWRRQDQPDDSPGRAPYNRRWGSPTVQLIGVARAQAVRAIRQGRVSEAEAWLQEIRRLEQLALTDHLQTRRVR